MQVSQVNISIQEGRLAGLAGRSYATNWTQFPNDRMPSEYQEVLGQIYFALTGKELDLAGSSIGISAEGGAFKKLYPPKLYGTEVSGVATGSYLKWSDEQIPVAVVDGRLVPEFVADGYTVRMKPTKFNPSGRGEDPGLEIKVTKGKQVWATVVSLAAADFRAYTPSHFETLVENAPESFYAALQVEKAKGGGLQIEGELLSTKGILEAAFPDGQTEQVEFTVTGALRMEVNAPKTGGTRTTHWLQCQAATSEIVRLRVPATQEPFAVWADPTVNAVLLSDPKPEVSAEKPATLVLPLRGRTTIRLAEGAVAESAGSLNLDF